LFTGIIEEIGTIKAVIKSTKSAKLIIQASKVLEETKIGDSISTNGVCLTVTDIYDSSFAVDVMAETIRKSSLSMLSQGDKVNLERALQVGDRLGGHIVSGHIDGTGTIRNIQQEDNAIWITVAADPMILRYIIPKGSITIDGISLTVAYVDDSIFKVSIIPHTKEVTTLLYKKVGDIVNLECDLVGKYIEKLLKPKEKQEEHSNIDLEFLSRNGFL
jgi:riboflavin synthase